MSLIVLGTIALDNVKTSSGNKRDLLGGSAVHFSMSARLFTKVHLVGIIGKDFPQRHIQLLRRKGIDLTSVTAHEGKSFRWDGEYRKGDYNTAITLVTELGVLLNFTPQVAFHQREIPNVFLANIDPDIQLQLLKLMGKPKLIGLDSMNLWIKNKRTSLMKLMKKIDLFVANDGEARLLTGESNLIKSAKRLRKMGPELVVIKKGEHGVFFYCDRFMFSFPAYPVENVVDPTGAGDTFAGGLMGFLSRGTARSPRLKPSAKPGRAPSNKINEKVLRKAVLYATTLASFNVEGFGMIKTASLSLNSVNKRMRQLMKFIAY
jgi:sugar/nucleoside kinase (ribokinase family)